jgi:predicted HAD superfamily hydrolase
VKVILVSDIYFSSIQLNEILSAVGAPMYEIITSTDEKITKSIGLFRVLQKR